MWLRGGSSGGIREDPRFRARHARVNRRIRLRVGRRGLDSADDESEEHGDRNDDADEAERRGLEESGHSIPQPGKPSREEAEFAHLHVRTLAVRKVPDRRHRSCILQPG
ncbi:MAG: hypothetical protein K0S65_3490 [Labilithrix sp.]|nr:hypothetical protein [Labilithrix sp.]